jgi:hypothetical protein
MLLTLACIAAFLLLYIIAAGLYPGGSDYDKTTRGFDWQHNYWCELLAPVAQNGEANTARPVAIAAMAVLMAGLAAFWYYIPLLFTPDKTGKTMIRTAGMGSMLVTPLLFTGWHDPVMNLAGLLGCFAIAVLLIRLFRHGRYFTGATAVFCLLLCAINNYVYYTGNYLYYLPVIQKISFAAFLSWFAWLAILLCRKK